MPVAAVDNREVSLVIVEYAVLVAIELSSFVVDDVSPILLEAGSRVLT